MDGASPAATSGQSLSSGTAKRAWAAGATNPCCQSEVAHISGMGAVPAQTVAVLVDHVTW